MTYISGPAIANLLAVHRMTVNKRMRAGHYGPVVKRGRPPISFVALAAVERRRGRQFSPAQIEEAANGYPDRVLHIASATTEAA